MAQHVDPEVERQRRVRRAIRSFSSWGNQTQLLTHRSTTRWSDEGRPQLDLFRRQVTNYASTRENFTGQRYNSWWRNGLLHREDGPARLDERYGIARFALNGYTLTFAHFCRLLELTPQELEGVRQQCGEFRPV
jgi:hypothetical protein